MPIPSAFCPPGALLARTGAPGHSPAYLVTEPEPKPQLCCSVKKVIRSNNSKSTLIPQSQLQLLRIYWVFFLFWGFLLGCCFLFSIPLFSFCPNTGTSNVAKRKKSSWPSAGAEPENHSRGWKSSS